MKRLFLLCLLATRVWAASETEVATPYLDKLKSKLKEPDSSAENYSERERAKLKPQAEAQSSEGYTEKLRHKDPALNPAASGAGYAAEERAKLAPKEDESAIQAFKEGRSELQFKREKRIRGAFGLRYGAGLTHTILASEKVAGRSFKDVYGDGHTPDLTVFGEKQFFNGETAGSAGLVGSLGFTYNSGFAKFGQHLRNALTGADFPEQSRVKVQFFSMPLMLGLDYRFNLARYIRPYVMAGGVLVAYAETRSDDKKGSRGTSPGVFFSGGALIPLDWLSARSTQDLYYDFGIKRYGITVEYSRLLTYSSDVEFTVSGINAGLTFEF